MTTGNWLCLILFPLILTILAYPMGGYMAKVFSGERILLTPVLAPVERFLYRIFAIDPNEEMSWKTYSLSLVFFNVIGIAVLFLLQLIQSLLPLNPQKLGSVRWDTALNTAISFGSNTNWQAYSGEQTMSYLTQMLGLTVQNFTSAAIGIVAAIAVIRGFVRKSTATIGNFWVDLTRGTLYILLPLSLILALLLVSQGVVQTLSAYHTAELLQPIAGSDASSITQQTIAVGPAASQIAIKQLGTNGGGFFNVNSAHPFENPTPLSNFLELLSILLIPAALCWTFGSIVNDKRQGWAVLAAMLLLFVGFLGVCAWAERQGNPALASLGVDIASGNLEGKETRFGVENSALWAVATTAASNGSVNSMHDSFLPLGGLVPMLLMQLGEVVFGGVGSGLYGMLLFVFIAVFVSGLMVGRTPEYLGKKIEPFEMKMAVLAILFPGAFVLVGTAIACLAPAGRATVQDAGPHAFSEILYAFSSASNNNGSAFAGLGANTPFYNTLLGLAMLVGRYWVIIPVLAIAGSLARKNATVQTTGTLPTHTPLFVILLASTVLIVGALTFVPALALGPIVEHLRIVVGQ